LPQSAKLRVRRCRQDLPHDNQRSRTDQQASRDGDATRIGHPVSPLILPRPTRIAIDTTPRMATDGWIIDKARESAHE
jgi:hypothetical protein